MKKWDVKMINVGPSTDLEAELKAEGQNGWRFAHALQTPFGIKFLLERQLDEDVPASAQDDELAKKFGI